MPFKLLLLGRGSTAQDKNVRLGMEAADAKQFAAWGVDCEDIIFLHASTSSGILQYYFTVPYSKWHFRFFHLCWSPCLCADDGVRLYLHHCLGDRPPPVARRPPPAAARAFVDSTLADVKYDDCGTTTDSFTAMRDAMNATGRPMFFSIHSPWTHSPGSGTKNGSVPQWSFSVFPLFSSFFSFFFSPPGQHLGATLQ